MNNKYEKPEVQFHKKFGKLTSAELRVMECFARTGAYNKILARELHLSVSSVKSHLVNIGNFAGTNNRSELLLWWQREGEKNQIMKDMDWDDFFDELRKKTNQVLTKIYGGQPIDSQGILEAEIRGWLKAIYGPEIEIGKFYSTVNSEGQREFKCNMRFPIKGDAVYIEIAKCLDSVADDFDPKPRVDGA